MRTIREPLNKENTVWMYLDSEEVCRAFYKQAHEEGFRFGALPYAEWAAGYAVAVHADGSMDHLPLFIWTAAFGPDGLRGIEGSHTPIDYRQYASGAADYICKTSHFQDTEHAGNEIR